MGAVIVRRLVPAIPDLPTTPLLQRIYAARAVRSPRELDHSLGVLAHYESLTDIRKAVDLLFAALIRQQRVLIVADYDADGATSCALALRALRAMGHRNLGYLVPNRFEHGYGLTPEIVVLAARRQPQLLITVDNGIASLEGVAEARRRGMRVLVTDHHLPAGELPEADAIVNPNQPGDAFPSKHLAGVGVIFYVMAALRARLQQNGWFRAKGIPEPNMARFLDLVALGTVADVVPLDHNNRILVEQGLRRIRAGQCAVGVAALADVSGRCQDRLTATDIAFGLGPRLNAAGRLEDMSYGIQCLLGDDHGQALMMARRLDAFNRERRAIEADMQAQAMASLGRLQLADRDLPVGLCLYDEGWHQGVIGILAARVKEQTHRPVIVFAPDRDDRLKGSARSVPGLHMRDVLDTVAIRHPGVISKFGGHAMAAGLSLPLNRFETFCEAFDAEVRRRLAPDDLCGRLYSDGELSAAEISLEVAEQLRDAGPWGTGFPEPLFDGVFDVVSYQPLQDKHGKLILRLPGGGFVEAMAFNRWPVVKECLGLPRVGIAYRLDVNEWRGERRVRLNIEHIEAA